MMDKATLLIIAIVVFALWRQNQENEESWEIQRDANGKLVGITVHRQVRSV